MSGFPEDGCVEQGRELVDHDIEGSHVSSNSGQNDRTFERADHEDGQLCGSHPRYACLHERRLEWLLPIVEGLADYMAKMVAVGRDVSCSRDEWTTGVKPPGGELIPPAFDDAGEEPGRRGGIE